MPTPEIFVFTAAGPAAQEHFERTILRPVPLEKIGAHDAAIATDLSGVDHGSLRCWGSVPGPGNVRSWQRMQPGHWAMLYTGSGEFPYLLQVAHKAESKVLAQHLWGDNPDGNTWQLMYFFDRVVEANLGIEAVRASLGYDGDWWPQGLQYPTPEHQGALLAKFGSLTAFVESAAADGEQVDAGRGPSGSEALLGGTFKGAPEKPPKPREQRPSDPDIAGRGYMAHERTVEKLAEHVGASFRKGTPGINHDGGWPLGDDVSFSIAEVKSITSRNEVGQLQKGLGQLLHNRFKAKRLGIEIGEAYLVAEKEPANSALWRDLAAAHSVILTWPERFESDIRLNRTTVLA